MSDSRRNQRPELGPAPAHPGGSDRGQGGDASPGDVGGGDGRPSRVSPAIAVTVTAVRFASGRGPDDQPATFRLPPKIEWMLDTWHTRAHAGGDGDERDRRVRTDPADSDKPTTA